MAAGSVIGGVPIAVWRSSMLRQITALLVPRDSGLLDRGHNHVDEAINAGSSL